MANDYFQFRHFTIYQGRCAMKVGTDGTLLGAWARGGQTVLDIGTGTGLIALMMAQRFPEAQVVGVDVDPEAVAQARENVAASPFASRIQLLNADIRTHHHSPFTLHHSPFTTIVSNPPYFVDSLACPDGQRTLARHTASLSYRELMQAVCRLLADDGEFSVVIPFDCKARMEAEATLAGLFKVRECAVKTTPRKQPRRYLMAFRKHPADLELAEGVIETSPNVRSSWYQELTKDFYL
jgi:tRNA1Val (adenine37-N6)-methyltransferase